MWRLSFILITSLLLTGCMVGSQQLGLSRAQWQAMDKVQRQQLLAGYKQFKQSKPHRMVYSGPNLSVVIAHGTVMMPPFIKPQPYVATKFRITSGQCRNVRLASVDASDAVNVRVCYNGLVLMLDPSHFDPAKRKGTLRFSYNPMWKRGFTYNGVSSSGYVRLHNAAVTIKATFNVAAVQDVSNHPSA